KLTPRQQRFVDAYVAGDAAAGTCYRRAGYAAATDGAAYAGASRLLRNAKVSAAVESARRTVTDAVVREAAVRNLVTVEEVIGGLKREANFKGKGASHSARVAAWGKLADLLGLNREPDREPDSVRVNVINVYLSAQPEEPGDPGQEADGLRAGLPAAPRPD